MKNKLYTLIFALVMLALPMGVFAQKTIHDPSITPTVTPEQLQAATPTPSKSGVVVLDFEGLGNVQQVLDYYNGGFAGGGIGPGPDYGVTFSGSTLSIIAGYAGGTGNFQNEPSPSTIMFFLDENNAIMNYAAGFETGFSFFYSSIDRPGSVEVYDEVGGMGNMIASLNLAPLGSLNIPGGAYNIWQPIGVSFEGVAKSIKFIGAANYIGFDNVTFGSEIPGGDDGGEPQPVPLSNWALILGLGLIVLFTVLRMKRIA